MRPAKEIVRLLCAVLVLAGPWCADVSASLEEVEDGVYVDDFEDGMLLDWELDDGTDAELTDGEENSLLNVRGKGKLVLADMEFRDFSMEVTVSGGGAGIEFGGKYQALLTTSWDGSVRVVESGKELAMLKRGYKIGRSYRLKVVSAGPLIRVYVNGRKEFEKTDASPVKGPLALVTDELGALLDDVRISTKLSPEDGAMAVPVEDDQALVFSSEADAIVHLSTANCSDRDVRLLAAIRHPQSTLVEDPAKAPPKEDTGGKKGGAKGSGPKDSLIVKYGTQYYYSIEALPGKPVAQAEAPLKAKSRKALDLNLGKVPAGTYLLNLSFSWGGKEQGHRQCLFASFKDTEPVEYQAPVIPIGTYTHKVPKAMKDENPLWWWTYIHAMALTLKQHHLNAVVACGAYEPDTIEVLNRYGVAVVERGDAHLDHPGVIGTLLGDEPHGPEMDYYRAQYEEVQKKTEKPVSTTCVGEGIGMGGKYFFWEETNPKVRVFRWYGVKKHFYGIWHPIIYKGMLPLQDVLRISDATFDTPYWVVMPTNGGTDHEAYFQYPSPAQHRGYMHLCMAHGARGMLLYSLQAGFGVGLVDTVTLKPNGENLAFIGEVAGHIKRHAKLLQSLEVGKFDVRCSSPDIEPVPLHDGKDGRYVYAVNRNTKESVPCKLFWPKKLERIRVKDLYADAAVQTEIGESFVSVSLALAPGEGRLLEVSK